MDAGGVIHDIAIHVRRFIEMALWWFIVIFGVYTIYHQGNNAILSAIDQRSFIDYVFILGISLAVYFVLLFLFQIIYRIVSNKWKNEGGRLHSEYGTRAERYYTRRPERIPVGCRACGGPYPECKAGCNLFDD